MSKYRQMPIIIEAEQFRSDTWGKVSALLGEKHTEGEEVPMSVIIPTLEGTMTALRGDWIIKGVMGEVYICKPDIFEVTYEAVE